MQPSVPPPDDLLRTAIGADGDSSPDPSELAPHLPDFEILSLLGQGGMGAVYRVRRRSDGSAFALKTVRPIPGHEATFAARFAREAEALGRLHHPNIVSIHGHGQGGPWCWLLMDLIDGANLREIVSTGRLSSAQTLALVPPICAALQYAHDQGVIHRDLKPENILLDANGVPYLVDFGLAKLRDIETGSGLTNTGAAMGTVHYMAPEQVASAKDVDHRADIYALGVVIYELLTGQLPLGRFEAPSDRVQVDVRIDEVVLKALERDPEQRWQQMRQVGKAVADVRASPVSSRRWQMIHRAGMICAVLCGLISIAGAIFQAPDIRWYFAVLIPLVLALIAWVAACLLHQRRTRMLWLALGLLLGLGAAAYVIHDSAEGMPGNPRKPTPRPAPAPQVSPAMQLHYADLWQHGLDKFLIEMYDEPRVAAAVASLGRPLRVALDQDNFFSIPTGLDVSQFRKAVLWSMPTNWQPPRLEVDVLTSGNTPNPDAHLWGSICWTDEKAANGDLNAVVYHMEFTLMLLADEQSADPTKLELWRGKTDIRKELHPRPQK